MDKARRAKLEAAGWTVGTPQEFLNLTDEDAAFIEIKVALAAALKERRLGQKLSQVEAAKLLRTSQSRVAKMEFADKTVTVDLLIRSILKLGGTRELLAAAISR
jgi:predicted XRE-type DNA-binding protein